MNAMRQVSSSDAGFALVKGGKPLQWHHFFTDKNKVYTPQFIQIFQKYGLLLSDMWNKRLLPHLGRDPNEYHEFMLSKLKEFDAIAQGDINIFMQLIKDLERIITLHPDMLYKNYWR